MTRIDTLLFFTFEDFELDFFIDIHAHSTMMNGFMYGNIYEDAHRFEKYNIFPRLLSRNAEDFSIGNTTFNRDALKAGTGRRYKRARTIVHRLNIAFSIEFCRTLGGCLQESTHCYTLEVSFFSYQTSTCSQAIPYTEDLCKSKRLNQKKIHPDHFS
jgi:cytosolic carboxypeptidase protein 6